VKLAVLKSSLPSFAVMRALAMRFRGMMRSGKADGLDAWLRDAVGSGIYGMRGHCHVNWLKADGRQIQPRWRD
jgi:hypothetical protein